MTKAKRIKVTTRVTHIKLNAPLNAAIIAIPERLAVIGDVLNAILQVLEGTSGNNTVDPAKMEALRSQLDTSSASLQESLDNQAAKTP